MSQCVLNRWWTGQCDGCIGAESTLSWLQVKAGVPQRLMELALVSVAHFEPVEIQVLIEGTYPMLSFNLPRIKDEAFQAALACARNR